MGSFRQGVAHSNVQTPLLIVGGLLLLAVLLAIFQQQLRRRRRKQYHPALELQSNGVLGQIQRRKGDLNRFIGTLRSQLEIREQQLRLHDELEDMVTARVETGRQQDQEWKEIMRAGKKLHGKEWTQRPEGDGDQLSLKELMELHKHELLEMKATNTSGSGRRERRQSVPTARRATQIMQLPQDSRVHQATASSSSSQPLTATTSTSTLTAPSRMVPPQWQSTRRTAGSLNKPPTTDTDTNSSPAVADGDPNPWSKSEFQSQELTKDKRVDSVFVPKLDLTRLSSPQSQTPSLHFADKPKKSFEETFHRQARLASSLKQKKKT